uniref:Ketosteroid isomerase-like protein n=1 Tax=Paecilomyces fulvus TaxID=89137 RepID=A0A172WCU5_9EURO|nr:ketosteroid isomerase-like protein [Paecilomyces fulvus]
MVSSKVLIRALALYFLSTYGTSRSILPEWNAQQIPMDSVDINSIPAQESQIVNPNDDGFYFENPETNCKYASQPYIYDSYKHLAQNMFKLLDKIQPDVDFTIVGHHPVSGHYRDLKHVWINAFWRLTNCFLAVYPEEFDVTLLYIHGGCDQQWSVQEVLFHGRANNGRTFDMINVWVTKWVDGKMAEVRTYIDGPETTRILFENELWTNSSTETDHLDFIPGPKGMPDMVALSEVMAKYGHY